MYAKVGRKDFAVIFAMDDEGRFLNLVIPSIDGKPELDLTGKRQSELSGEEVSRLKVYARELKRSDD